MQITPANLAALEQHMPGAGGAAVWTQDGVRVAIPGLVAPGNDAPGAMPSHVVAVGAAWPVAHVADRLTLEFVAAAPDHHTVGVEVFDGRRWLEHRDAWSITVHPRRLEISFAPVATTMLRVRLPNSEGLRRIDIHRYLAESGAVAWPERVTGPALARQLLALDEEPSFESLALHGLSMPAWAMMGVKGSGYEQAVAWDGQIHLEHHRLALALGDPPARLADVRDTIQRRLVDDWLPAVVVEGQIGDVTLTQRSLVACTEGQGAAAARPATFVRIELTNHGSSAFTGPLWLELDAAPADPFLGTLGVEIFNPPFDTGTSRWEQRGRALLRNGRPFLVASQDFTATVESGRLRHDLSVAPGATVALEWALPCKPWQPLPDEALRLAEIPFDKALANCRAYWDALLAPAARIDLPEPRLNAMYRGILAQLFINAYGDVMPYGAAPSNYDGSVYGAEEGIAIRALAMFGFAADAHRYLDGTYLQAKFFEKAEEFTRPEQRNQQNRNGISVMVATDVLRLTRDHAWFARHLDLLRQCAEWTIAARRKTMATPGEPGALHHGLLPLWAYGGDLHDRCHPLFPNFACWRGLADTAWALAQFGHADEAARYQREADDYRAKIMAVVDVIYRHDATPPFLPLRLDAVTPDSGDFYQLFVGLLLEFMPFDRDDPRRHYLTDFLEADNRLFCELPRFRRDECHGGIDALYGLGHLLHHLHEGRIRQFLLGFYAYQAFNLEHNCYTSREQNRVYSSDRHLRVGYPVQDWSDPLPCASAVALLLLRHLLITEEIAGAGRFTGRLLILHGAPRRWYAPGQRIAVERALTHVGEVSFHVACSEDAREIRADVTLPREARCPGAAIRLRHPQGRPMSRVWLNGMPTTAFDPASQQVEIASPRGMVEIIARFD